MEAEQVDVGEVSSDFVRELIAVDEVKNKAKVRLDGWNGAFDKGDKKINGVGVDSSALVLGSQRDSSADVTGKRVGLWGDDTRRELTWWDGDSVEVVDVGDVVWADGGNGLGGACTGDSSAVVVRVSRELGGGVVAGVGWVGVHAEAFDLHGRIKQECNIPRR